MQTDSKNRISPIALVLFIGFTVVFIFVSIKVIRPLFQEQPESSGSLVMDKPAPEFSYPDLGGRNVSLSQHKGKVVLINVWATWCKPCVDEMPSLERLYQKFKDQPFEILAVSIDADGKESVAPFMAKHKLSFPALLDQKGDIRGPYGITGVPESFIIDRNGRMVKKIVGPLNWTSPQIIQYVHQLINNA